MVKKFLKAFSKIPLITLMNKTTNVLKVMQGDVGFTEKLSELLRWILPEPEAARIFQTFEPSPEVVIKRGANED